VVPDPQDLDEILDTPYDESMWPDSEHERYRADDRHAP